MSGRDGKSRRTTPATMPGALSIPASEEPEAAVPRRAPAPPQDANSEKSRRTARAVGAAAVAIQVSDSARDAMDPSGRTERDAMNPPGRTGSSSSNVGGAPSGKAHRTTAQATRPGAVAIAIEEPDSAITSRTGSSSSSVGGAPAGKARRTTGQSTRPGAVAVAIEEPMFDKSSRVPPMRADSSNSNTSGKDSRTTAPVLTLGAVSVAMQEPTAPAIGVRQVSGKGSKGVVPTGLTSRKTRRTTPAIAPGVVHVTVAAAQNAKEMTVETSELDMNEVTAVAQHHAVEGQQQETVGDVTVREGIPSVENDQKSKRKAAVGAGANTVPGAVTVITTQGAEEDALVAKVGKVEGGAIIPGAQSVTSSTNETQDSAVCRKDPRALHGRRNRDAAANAVATGAVVGTTAAANANRNHGTATSSLDDTEYRKRLENKVKEAERDLLGASLDEDEGFDEDNGANPAYENAAYDSLEKRAFDILDKDSHPFELDANKRSGEDAEPSAGAINPADPANAAPTVATADLGITIVPDVAYGTTGYGGPGLGGLPGDDALAVAIAIMEEDEDLFLPDAIEFDPDAKPALMRNRRFRLYAVSTVLIFISVIIAVILVVVLKPEEKPLPPETYAPTTAPSSSPSSDTEGEYREAWRKAVGPLVNVPGTPHNHAAEWMLAEENRLALDDPSLIQRYVLVLFYLMTSEVNPWRSCNPPTPPSTDTTCQYQRYGLKDNLPNYKPESSYRWLSSAHECLWAGNLCDDIQVTRAIDLFGQNITGTLPVEFLMLPFLQSIALAFNELTGTLPTEYASMRHLLSIEVHGNALEGTFPNEYYQATSLQNINIGWNDFTGTLSTEIGQLSNLKGFQTFDNHLTGTFPSEVAKLEFLAFSRNNDNRFSGTIPTELGELTLIQELWMGSNQFTGSIPTELGRMSALTDLRIHLNKLTGPIPNEIFSLRYLSRIDFFSNHLTGTLSTEIGQLTQLTELRISRNDFSGTMPTQLAALSLLRQAWLHSNQFDGAIPSGVCSLAPRPLEFVQTDCFPEGNSPNPCPCCTACCDRNTEICLILDDNAA